MTQDTYPLTAMFFDFAASTTGKNRAKLCLILQLIFFMENVSEAAPKIATSFAPAFTANSKPSIFGVKTG